MFMLPGIILLFLLPGMILGTAAGTYIYYSTLTKHCKSAFELTPGVVIGLLATCFSFAIYVIFDFFTGGPGPIAYVATLGSIIITVPIGLAYSWCFRYFYSSREQV